MILGLFLDRLDLPFIPLVVIILSFVVLIAGFAFMIFRHIYEKGESDIDPELYKKISTIAAWTFVIYLAIELIAACACVAVNEACRYGYHYDFAKKPTNGQALCKFCSGFKDADNHSAASDCLMLGIYFDVFIVNSFVTNTIKVVREKLSVLIRKLAK
jgi:Ni/Fe-hydrogenase subunit HybB-like protein